MDSVTQFALGAAVGAAVLGPRIGPRKALLVGGLLGTAPDLDTFLPVADPVEAFTAHRGATHSLIMQALATPVFAEAVMRLFREIRGDRLRTYIGVYLIFATHALIDAMTVYGTRLLWPLSDHPFGVGSVFIIDPVYTLPLVIALIWGLCLGRWTETYRRVTRVTLAVSTAYMLLTIPLQQWMQARAESQLADAGVAVERVLAIPTPFNVLYWRTIAIAGDRYLNLYMPVFGDAGDTSAFTHPRRPDLAPCLSADQAFRELRRFTKGFYRLEDRNGRIIFSDLRMGLTPNYVFRFHLADEVSNGARVVSPPTREPVIRGTEGDWPWILAGIRQDPIPRQAEAPAAIPLESFERSPRLVGTACQKPAVG